MAKRYKKEDLGPLFYCLLVNRSEGDVLLLQGRSHDLQIASEQGKLMLVEGADSSILRTTKNRVALIIMLVVVLLAGLSPIPIVILAMTGAGLMVLTKCLRITIGTPAQNERLLAALERL